MFMLRHIEHNSPLWLSSWIFFLTSSFPQVTYNGWWVVRNRQNVFLWNWFIWYWNVLLGRRKRRDVLSGKFGLLWPTCKTLLRQKKKINRENLNDYFGLKRCVRRAVTQWLLRSRGLGTLPRVIEYCSWIEHFTLCSSAPARSINE